MQFVPRPHSTTYILHIRVGLGVLDPFLLKGNSPRKTDCWKLEWGIPVCYSGDSPTINSITTLNQNMIILLRVKWQIYPWSKSTLGQSQHSGLTNSPSQPFDSSSSITQKSWNRDSTRWVTPPTRWVLSGCSIVAWLIHSSSPYTDSSSSVWNRIGTWRL